MTTNDKKLSDSENDILMSIGVYQNDAGEYYYGEKTDKDGNVIIKGTVINNDEALELAKKLLTLNDSIPTIYRPKNKNDTLWAGVEFLLKTAGYESDDDGNYHKADGTIVAPRELLEIAEKTNEKLKNDVKKAGSILKECGVYNCKTNLDLHPKDNLEVGGKSGEQQNMFDQKQNGQNPLGFDLAKMKSTVFAFNFFSNPEKLAEFQRGLKESRKYDPDNFNPVDMSKFSKTTIFKELAAGAGDYFIQKNLIGTIEKAYMQSDDPSVQTEFLMASLKNSIISFQKELKGKGGESIMAIIGVDWNSGIFNSATAGVVAGFFVKGSF